MPHATVDTNASLPDASERDASLPDASLPDAKDSVDPLIAAYAAHLATRASAHTRNAYLRDAGALARLATESTPRLPLERATGAHLRRFLSTLHGRGLSARSLARMLSSWRSFYRYLAEEGNVVADPCVGLKPPK